MCSAELSAPGAPVLVDTHCRTEYAYCATGVSARENVRLSKARGLDGVCLLEHTFQLYFDREEAWSFRWQTDRSMVARSWAAGRGRMDDYRRFVTELNVHNNQPDPAFFEECLARGVRIALATDAHALDEVGVLDPHLALLRRLGVGEGDWPDVLYVPSVRPVRREA